MLRCVISMGAGTTSLMVDQSPLGTDKLNYQSGTIKVGLPFHTLYRMSKYVPKLACRNQMRAVRHLHVLPVTIAKFYQKGLGKTDGLKLNRVTVVD